MPTNCFYYELQLHTYYYLKDDLASAGDIGDSKALLDQSGTFAMQKLKFDSCQISLAACRLLKLVHEVMKQACSSVSAKVANILFQSARDCLEIFLAVVPLRLGCRRLLVYFILWYIVQCS